MLATQMKTEDQWLDRPVSRAIPVSVEVLLFVIILLATVFTRFYNLGTRVMSHDETSHVYFSWLLSTGKGYQHDPITHGPFQFHIVALSYFLFGDNDFTARIPAALFSIITVALVWKFRRYLGRAGALIAAGMMLISPYILYYGRYVRNEAFIGVWALLTLYAILRYIETGRPRYTYLLSAAIVLHFATKETAYIYTAQALLFLAFYFIYRITQTPWLKPNLRAPFLQALILALALLAGAGVLLQVGGKVPAAGTTPAPPAPSIPAFLPIVLGVLALVALAFAIYLALKGYGLKQIRQERSFDLLMLLGTLVLPLLAAFPLDLLNLSVPTSVGAVNQLQLDAMIKMGAVLIAVIAVAVALGLWWKARLWSGNALLFYGIFIVLYTTLFTNGAGVFTGLLGGLGYWLEQQAVERGQQPWYYYALIQVPAYEYLPLVGSMIAFILAALGKIRLVSTPQDEPAELGEADLTEEFLPAFATTPEPDGNPLAVTEVETVGESLEPDVVLDSDPLNEPAPPPRLQPAPVFALLAFWSASSLFAYSYAGEKMPWLTFHISLPMILLSGWALGYLIESTNWRPLREWRSWLVLALLPVVYFSLASTLGSLFGPNPPFQGKELIQLEATSEFLTAFLVTLASVWGLYRLLKEYPGGQVIRLFTAVGLVLLAVLTLRKAVYASFVNYDNASELLVYAHSGPGVKEAMAQIEELSRRTTDGLAMVVAYDDDTSYPYWWYLRHYPNQRFFGANPTRDLRNAPAILVGEKNYSKIQPVVGEAYYSFEYIRMWWPNQDYFNLTWDRIWYALTNRDMRAAIFDIWLSQDYTRFGQLANKDVSLPRWDPAQRMRLYLRKDIAAQIWNYGASPTPGEVVADPYEGKGVTLAADLVLGQLGSEPGQFKNPRSVAVAPDGTLYVADSGNHRIQHIDLSGQVIDIWGTQGKTAPDGAQPAPGTFDEPWGIAVGPDGSVYVADTWNNRIQKFTADGQFSLSWGRFGQRETPDSFWGPRGLAVDAQGRVYVCDTGNDRVVVFDENGNFLFEFGIEGFGPVEMNEPVDVAINAEGHIYVADTWNQRVQALVVDESNQVSQMIEWEIVGWYGESVENKPYISVDSTGNVFVTDPEGYRVLQFTGTGEFVKFWGDFGLTNTTFSITNGIEADPLGGVWVVDAGNSRLMHFTP